jgi:hypothetical protein
MNLSTHFLETNTNNIEDSSSEDDSDSTDSEMDTIQNIITPCSTPSTLDKMLLNYSFCKYDLQKVNIIPYCH